VVLSVIARLATKTCCSLVMTVCHHRSAQAQLDYMVLRTLALTSVTYNDSD
jgi:hypothetical protein